MYFKSKLFWGGVIFCVLVVVFLGILLYKDSTQSKEPIVIYNTVIPELHTKSHALDQSIDQPNTETGETKTNLNTTNSYELLDDESSAVADIQLSNVEVDPHKNIASYNTNDPVVSASEERLFNLTLTEMEEKISVLEQGILTNLTIAVALYEDLLSTDGMAGKSPEIAAWRKETWNEVKQLVHDITDNGKMLEYVSYLRVTGEENPMNPGGWISDLLEPLPIQVTIDLNF